MTMAVDMLTACRTTFARAQAESDPALKRALRVSGRAMLKAVGAALRQDFSTHRDGYRAYAEWRANPDAHEIFWTFINIEDTALSELLDNDDSMVRHFRAVTWWEEQLRGLPHNRMNGGFR